MNTFYITILSTVLPIAIGFAEESTSAGAASGKAAVSSNGSIESVQDAVTLEPSDIPENAIEVGTIGPDDSATGNTASSSSTYGGRQSSSSVSNLQDATSRSATGMTVEAVTLQQPGGDSSAETIEVEATADAPELNAPDLEINFPVGEEEMTLDFPTDSGSASDLAMADDETISVDFPDEEVRTIISNVADLYDLNVVVPQGLEGRTTIKLRNVTWRQVFDVVLEPLDYTYVEERNIIKIRAFAELDNETDTRVFHINYAVADQLQNSLTPLVDASKGGLIRVDMRTNALIITERPTQMNQITEIIERLDRPNAQVMIESKFVEIRDVDTKKLGLDWSSLDEYEIGISEFSRSLGRSDSLIQDSTVFSASDFNVLLSALNDSGNTEIISNPTVVTLDGEKAKIAIGERYPIPSYNYNNETGRFEVSGFEYLDIGINLDVRPQVNNAGFIRLSIIPEVSDREDSVNFGSGGGTAEIPIINSTRTESEIILKDGYTLAIGGLMRSEVTDGRTTVPLLSDIPVLGKLFQSKEIDSTRNNLVIFVTAKVLNPDGTTYKDILDPRLLHDMELLDSDIPGYEIPDKELRAMEEIHRLRSEAARMKSMLEHRATVNNLNQEEGENYEPQWSGSDSKSFRSRAR